MRIMKRKTEIITAFGFILSIVFFFQISTAFCSESGRAKTDIPSEFMRLKLIENKIIVARIYPDWQTEDLTF